MTRRSVVAGLFSVPLAAFAQKQRASPHETVSLALGDQKVTITYGRPSLKGRPLSSLAPEGKVWRLGADEATKLTLSAPGILNGTLHLPAGSYALFAVPGSSSWTVIVSKTAEQWGAFDYDQKQDAGRFTVAAKKAPSTVEQFTIQLAKASADTAAVTMMWQDVSISFPLKFG